MNEKRVFGGVLTLAGMAGLIYAAIVFGSTSGAARDVKSIIIFGLLGTVFFITGIGLVRSTKDQA